MAYHVKNEADKKAVKDCVKGLDFEAWAEKLRTTFNNDSVIRIRVEKGIFKKGDNAFIDKMVFKKDTTVNAIDGYPIDAVYGKMRTIPTCVTSLLQTIRTSSRRSGWHRFVSAIPTT